jgi:hypothetical protein
MAKDKIDCNYRIDKKGYGDYTQEWCKKHNMYLSRTTCYECLYRKLPSPKQGGGE